jgi:hypothetical protein
MAEGLLWAIEKLKQTFDAAQLSGSSRPIIVVERLGVSSRNRTYDRRQPTVKKGGRPPVRCPRRSGENRTFDLWARLAVSGMAGCGRAGSLSGHSLSRGGRLLSADSGLSRLPFSTPGFLLVLVLRSVAVEGRDGRDPETCGDPLLGCSRL